MNGGEPEPSAAKMTFRPQEEETTIPTLDVVEPEEEIEEIIETPVKVKASKKRRYN